MAEQDQSFRTSWVKEYIEQLSEMQNVWQN